MSDELLDRVNDTDLVIGQELRSVAHQRGLLHIGAHIYLVTPENKLIKFERIMGQKTGNSASYMKAASIRAGCALIRLRSKELSVINWLSWKSLSGKIRLHNAA